MLYSIRNLTRDHGARRILDISELDIEPNKVYTLIGPNGAGKTTLLNILAFLDCPSSGVVNFLGNPVSFSDKKLRQLRRDVVMVDQYPILFTGPVWKNIDFGLRIRNIPKPLRVERIRKALEMVGMERFSDADAHRLSGGETKRVALARALAIEPKVLLCDEPTANVDSENQEIILRILERCNSEDKVSLVFATHYLSQAQRLSDHTIVLENGRLTGAGRDNVFQAIRIRHERGISTWEIGDRLLLHLPDEEGLLGDFQKIHIDPRKIRLLANEQAIEDAATIWCGSIRKLEKLNGSVRLDIDAGHAFQVVVSDKQYRMAPMVLNEQVRAEIPADAVTIITDQQ